MAKKQQEKIEDTQQQGFVADSGETLDVQEPLKEDELEDQYNFDAPDDLDDDPFEEKQDDDTSDDSDVNDSDDDNADDTNQDAGEDSQPSEEIDMQLLARATRLGFDPEKARKLDKDTLSSVLDVVENRPTEQKQEKDDQKDDQQDTTQDAASKLEKLDPEEYEFADQWNAMVDMVQNSQKTIKQQEDFIRSMQQRDFDRQFDTSINSLGEDYESVFGNGTVESLDKSSEQFKNRAAIVEEVIILDQAYRMRGQTPPPLKELVQRAVSYRFPNAQKQAKDRRDTQSAQQRQSQMISRPSRKNSPKSTPSDGRSAAIQAVGAKMNELGVDSQWDIDEEF